MKTKTYHVYKGEKESVMKQLIDTVKDRNDIVFAYVFGSFTEGNDAIVHDIDVGVYVAGIKKETATAYSLDMAYTLTKKTLMPVDVTVLNFAPTSFLYHVIRGSAFFVRDEDFMSQVVENTVRRYLDLKPLIRRGIKEAFAA
jgi:predicted nucleotidyltransferase